MTYQTYYWLTFIASVYMLFQIPSKQSAMDNFTGTILAAMLAPVLWPIYAYAFWKVKRNAAIKTEGGE